MFCVPVDDVDSDADEEESPDITIRAERERDGTVVITDGGVVTNDGHAHPCLHLESCDDDSERKDDQPETCDDTEEGIVRIEIGDEQDKENKEPDVNDVIYHTVS